MNHEAKTDSNCADCAGFDVEWMHRCERHDVEFCRGCECPYCDEERDCGEDEGWVPLSVDDEFYEQPPF